MCREIWRCLQSTRSIASSMWQWVAVPWRQCSAQTCNWWCLCCNKWVCWIALVLLAILVIVFIILIVVWCFVLLVICEALCIIFTILQAPSGNITVRCFRYWDEPSGTPPGGGTGTDTGGLTSPSMPIRPGTGTTTGTRGSSAGARQARREIDNASSFSELETAMRWSQLLRRTRPINLDGLPADEGHVRVLQAALERRAAACGCREGKIGLALSTMLVGWVVVSDAWSLPVTGSAAISIGLGALLGGALAGKIAGMVRAHVGLRRAMRGVQGSFRPS